MAWITQSAARAHGATAIFISYRRDDAAGHAGRVADHLKARFGTNAVFMDVSGSIKPGEAFGEAIGRAVSSCDALLAIIGRHWLTLTDSAGTRRIDDPDDYVRVEIARALARDVCVIPVLVDRASLPLPGDLPEDLRDLLSRQTIELSENRWDFDVSQLAGTLEALLPQTSQRAAFPKWLKGLMAAAVMVALAIATPKFWPDVRNVPSGISTPAVQGAPAPAEPRRPSPTTQPTSPPVNAAAELVVVPDVRGMELDAAKARLREFELTTGAISYYTLPGRAADTVYHQDTASGTRVRPKSAIGLFVVRQRRAGIQSSGLLSLSDAEVWDLDGTSNSGRDGLDVRFDGSHPGGPRLQALDGAQLSMFGRSPPSRDACVRATFSPSAIPAQIGTYVCARTGEGRYASLRIEDLSRDLRLSFETWDANVSTPLPATPERAVRLANRDSYDFSGGTRGTLGGGDFYVVIASNGAAQFFANNEGQRGLIDIGDIGHRPLTSVTPPASGYHKFGVPTVDGHTYVSLASEGEEGHFIIFRVVRVTDTLVFLSYIYR